MLSSSILRKSCVGGRVKMVHDEALTGTPLPLSAKSLFPHHQFQAHSGTSNILFPGSWNEKVEFSGCLIMESNEDTRDVKFYPVGFVPRNSPTQTHDQIATTLASCISKPGFLHFPSWIPAFPILTWPLQAWKMHQPLQSLIWKSKFWNFCSLGEKFSLRTQTW